jgi:hypothetical protein
MSCPMLIIVAMNPVWFSDRPAKDPDPKVIDGDHYPNYTWTPLSPERSSNQRCGKRSHCLFVLAVEFHQMPHDIKERAILDQGA